MQQEDYLQHLLKNTHLKLIFFPPRLFIKRLKDLLLQSQPRFIRRKILRSVPVTEVIMHIQMSTTAGEPAAGVPCVSDKWSCSVTVILLCCDQNGICHTWTESLMASGPFSKWQEILWPFHLLRCFSSEKKIALSISLSWSPVNHVIACDIGCHSLCSAREANEVKMDSVDSMEK